MYNGGGPGVKLVGLPFWFFFITYIHIRMGGSANFGGGLICPLGPHIWWGSARFGGPTIFYFWNLVLGPSLGIFPLPHGNPWLGHVAANHWATQTTYTITYHISIWSTMPLYDLPPGCMDCHVALFHWSIDRPKNEWHVAASSVVTWQWWCHDDVNMTCVTS